MYYLIVNRFNEASLVLSLNEQTKSLAFDGTVNIYIRDFSTNDTKFKKVIIKKDSKTNNYIIDDMIDVESIRFKENK